MEILFIFPGFILAIFIVVMYEIYLRKLENKVNKVHFYVTRDKDGDLTIWMGKPKRALSYGMWYGNNKVAYITSNKGLPLYGLNPKDFDNLKWEDEPVEVFLKLNN